MKQPINIRQPQKTSLVAILIHLLNNFRKLWPIALILLIQVFNNSEKAVNNRPPKIYVLIGVIVVVVFMKIQTIVQYFTTRFFINDNDEFVYNSGFLNKKTTIIPIQKIQSLQSKQSLINRISNTYSLNIETAGSAKAEVSLPAISEAQYLALQNWLQTSESLSAATEIINVEAPEKQTHKSEVLQLTVNDFLRLCISENHFKTLLIIAAFIFGKLQDVKDFLGLKAEEVIDSGVEKVGNAFNNVLLVIVFVLVLTILVSAIRLLLKYFNFQVQIADQKLYMQWGLINTQQKTVAFTKIQMLSYKSNLVRRWLKLAILRIYTLGEEETQQESQITLPITNTHQIQNLTNAYQNNLVFDESHYLTIQKGYITSRLLLIGLPTAFLLSIPALKFQLYFIAIPILWLLYFTISNYFFVKKYKAFVSENCIKVFQGIWGSETYILKWHNIQGIAIKTSPFQRKNGLANLVIKTTDAPIVLPFIPVANAIFLYNYALVKMETKTF